MTYACGAIPNALAERAGEPGRAGAERRRGRGHRHWLEEVGIEVRAQPLGQVGARGGGRTPSASPSAARIRSATNASRVSASSVSSTQASASCRRATSRAERTVEDGRPIDRRPDEVAPSTPVSR